MIDIDKIIYRGFIVDGTCRENYSALQIGHIVVAEELQDEIDGKQVTARYWISDKEKSKQDLQENQLLCISGALHAEYTDRYSDYTGYLWTHQDLRIGGHDLIAELWNNVGKFIHLEIEVH